MKGDDDGMHEFIYLLYEFVCLFVLKWVLKYGIKLSFFYIRESRSWEFGALINGIVIRNEFKSENFNSKTSSWFLQIGLIVSSLLNFKLNSILISLKVFY